MNKVVLDASALLALIRNEPGALVVEKLLGGIVMSSINISEVAATLLTDDMSETECRNLIMPFIDTIVDFNANQAYTVAMLKPLTKSKGLSLADRACIAVGMKFNIPIYTADRIWSELQIKDTNIHLIR